MPSLRTFVSRVSHSALLRALLSRHKIELAAEQMSGTPTAVVTSIEEQFAALPLGAHALLDRDIATVDALTTEAGQLAIRDVTLDEEVADLPSPHARSLWLFLHDRQRFRQAEEIFYADQKRLGREWTAFVGEKNCDLKRDTEAVEALKAALREHFQTPKVHLDIFERTRIGFVEEGEDDGVSRITQITIYREGWPNDEYAFDGPELITRTHRPVLEAAVTYDAATGTLECIAKQKDSRAEVVRLVATSLLGAATDFQPVSAPVYDLDVLRQRHAFDADIDDGIESVRVAMLRLAPMETDAESVVVESMPAAGQDIWSMVDQRLGAAALDSLYRIKQAKIAIRYVAAGANKSRLLTFTITQPHRSSLKELEDIERTVANKYLPRWGLVAP